MNASNKILMLLQSPFIDDERVRREISSLSKAGFRVSLICNQYLKETISKEGIDFNLHINGAPFNSEMLNKVINFPFFLNPRFAFKILLVFLREKPDVVHTHDLPMAPFGLILKLLFRVKFVLDLHENYPDALIYFKKKGIINYLFKNPKLARILEIIALKYADKVVVVVEEHKEKLISENVLPSKIVVIKNTLDIPYFSLFMSNPLIVSKYSSKFVLLYEGYVSPERGLDIPIQAIKNLKERIPNILLLIVGDGIYVEYYKHLVLELELSSFIEFIPWPGFENIASYMEVSDICIYTQPRNRFSDCGLPNKLFEYMYSEKKVVVSDISPLKRIVTESKSGLIFRSNDINDFVDKVMEAKKSNISFGNNGKIAVENKYCWEIDSKVLINFYNQFIGS